MAIDRDGQGEVGGGGRGLGMGEEGGGIDHSRVFHVDHLKHELTW